MNWGIYFRYCYWDGDYILYAKQVADSGPGSPRLPPDGWWPLAMAGGVSESGEYS